MGNQRQLQRNQGPAVWQQPIAYFTNPRTSEDTKERHIRSTYGAVRRGMAILAVMYPIALYFYGKVFSIALQNSFSNYFHAGQDTSLNQSDIEPWWGIAPAVLLLVIHLWYSWQHPDRFPRFSFLLALVGFAAYLFALWYLYENEHLRSASEFRPMRTVFTGILVTLGFCLYFYKGETEWENVLLNLAGGFAILTALFAMAKPGAETGEYLSWHGAYAYGLFGCTWIVCVFCSSPDDETTTQSNRKHGFLTRIFERLGQAIDPRKKWLEMLIMFLSPRTAREMDKARIYRQMYDTIGVLMVAIPISVFVLYLARYGTLRDNHSTFWAEAASFWAFGSFWWAKSDEMESS